MFEFILGVCAVAVLVGVTSMHRIWARHREDSDQRYYAFVAEAARYMGPRDAARFFSNQCRAGHCQCRHTCAAILYDAPRTVLHG